MAQILPRPEGTLPYQQSAGEQLFNALISGINKYQSGKQDRTIREAIAKEMARMRGAPYAEPKRTFWGDIVSAMTEPRITKAEEEIYPTIWTERIKAEVSPEAEILRRLFPKEATPALGGEEQPAVNKVMPEVTSSAERPEVTLSQARRGFISKKLGIPYEQMMTPEERQREIEEAAKKTRAIEAIKPLTEIEAGVVSKGELLVPVIDKLINLVEKNKVYEGVGVPFGASRIAAFGEKGPWQSFKRGLTAGKGREAGLLLKDIKILAFGEGGKTLSENERMTALSNIDPSYKTEEQWIEGLKRAKALLLRKAELMTKGKEIPQSDDDYSRYLQAIGAQ